MHYIRQASLNMILIVEQFHDYLRNVGYRDYFMKNTVNNPTNLIRLSVVHFAYTMVPKFFHRHIWYGTFYTCILIQ